jgi:hypothetical protein
MRLALKLLLPALAVFLLAQLGGCGCGFDCHSDDNPIDGNPATLTLGLSDALPEDLKQVVIELDAITFKRSGSSDIVVDEFMGSGGVEEPTLKVDLLKYRGENNLVVITDLEMPTGTYDAVEIKIVVGDVNNSYVMLQNDTQQVLTVTNGVLQLPGMQLDSGAQKFVVDFGLAQALQQQTSDYLLSNTGVRIENTATAATLGGDVDAALFDFVAPCTEKTDPEAGNRIYLYQRVTSTTARLGDVFTNSTNVPANVEAPFAVASLVEGSAGLWTYSFGYLPAGDYTMAFACNTQADNSVTYNNLTIPLPTNQRHDITLTEGEHTVCDLAEAASC